MAKKAVERALARASNKMIERARHEVGVTSDRLSARADGARLTRAAQDIQLMAQDIQRSGPAAAPDLRNEIARKVAELSELAGGSGLLRAPNELHRSDDPAPEGDSADGEVQVFDQWMEDLRAQGMTEPEIEEHVVSVIRGLRAQMIAESTERLVLGG